MPLTPGQRHIYGSGYNYLVQTWMPDGTVWLLCLGGSDPHDHRMHVSDLWGPNETVLAENVIPRGPPAWIIARFNQIPPGQLP